MKSSLAVFALMAAAVGINGARADHGPPPGASYEMRELYDQQHFAGQGWLGGEPRVVTPAREPGAGNANNAKAQTTKPAYPRTTRPTSGHGDW